MIKSTETKTQDQIKTKTDDTEPKLHPL